MLEYLKKNVIHYMPCKCLNEMHFRNENSRPTLMCVRSAYYSIKRTLKDDLSHSMIDDDDYKRMMDELDETYEKLRDSGIPFHERDMSYSILK